MICEVVQSIFNLLIAMPNLFGAESIPIYYNRPGPTAATNTATGNTVPAEQSDVIHCFIHAVGDARGRFIREEFPGADETYLPVHVKPDTAECKWPDHLVKNQILEGTLIYGGRDAYIEVKIAPLDSRVQGMGLQSMFGHKAIGMIKYH